MIGHQLRQSFSKLCVFACIAMFGSSCVAQEFVKAINQYIHNVWLYGRGIAAEFNTDDGADP